jgi:glycosyltransferase involved in cell wall biosynthesis
MGNDLKILHVIPTLDPRAGGPPLICSHIAAAQAVLGHEVHIMTYRSRPDGLKRIIADNRQHGFERVTQHLLPFITWRERVLGNDALVCARGLVPQVDAIHIHGIWEPQLIHTAAIARKLDKPYLVLLHGMLLPWSMRRGVWKKRFVLTIGTKKMLNRGILQFGSGDEELAARRLGFTNPGVIIPNGTSPEEMADLPLLGTIRKLQPGLGDDPYVLFLGRLHEQKGVDLLLNAFAIIIQKVPSAKLLIAGPDYGRSDEIKSQMNLAGLQGRLLLVGPLYGQEKLAALRDANCFCLPSRHEGFSLAVLEALACGVPVVISPECHFPEVAQSGAGLIPPLEPAAIAEALRTMLEDKEFRDRAAYAAKELVATRYTWLSVAKQIVDAYR